MIILLLYAGGSLTKTCVHKSQKKQLSLTIQCNNANSKYRLSDDEVTRYITLKRFRVQLFIYQLYARVFNNTNNINNEIIYYSLK